MKCGTEIGLGGRHVKKKKFRQTYGEGWKDREEISTRVWIKITLVIWWQKAWRQLCHLG